MKFKKDNEEIPISLIMTEISRAKAAFVLTGAGMSASSNLPTFRGKEGFWKEYPPYKKLGLSFYDLACPNTFINDLPLALGFYGSRLKQYQEAKPHSGYKIINDWLSGLDRGGFVKTSNVDGHHFTEGYNRVHEIHGTINQWQCSDYKCANNSGLFEPPRIDIDYNTMRAEHDNSQLCPCCSEPLRPNILMFDDVDFNDERTNQQSIRHSKFLNDILDKPCIGVVLEIGAGSGIPSIRFASESIARDTGFTHIVINNEDDSDKYQRSPKTIYATGDAEKIINLLFE